MKIVGLITEYNPFHNGHLYHIQKAKEITGADYAVIVMSGNFVQRGAPAIMPKHLRAESALASGADLVLELPVCFATGSAEFFAEGAIALLDSLGCVDAICFGSECGDCHALGSIAQILIEEPEQYKTALQNELRKGISFPQARDAALQEYYNKTSIVSHNEHIPDAHTLSEILEHPNNILGIEYMKALYKRNSSVKCCSIKRIGASYHDNELSESYSSASAIRRTLAKGILPLKEIHSALPENLISQLPPAAGRLMMETYNTRYPVYANDFSLLLKYRLLQETKETLTSYMDVSEDLANRMINLQNEFQSFYNFCDTLKTKEVTYARISRALLHILLNIKSEDLEEYRKTGYCHYARILGFRKDSTSLLSLLKERSEVPIITKLTQTEGLSDIGRTMLSQNIFADNLYESVITDKFQTPFVNEYQKQIVKV